MNTKRESDIKSKNDMKVQDLKDVEWLKNIQNRRQNTNIYSIYWSSCGNTTYISTL